MADDEAKKPSGAERLKETREGRMLLILIDLAHFIAWGSAIYGFWHFFLVPAGLKELHYYQIFGLMMVGRYLFETIKEAIKMTTYPETDPSLKQTRWQIIELVRLIRYAVLLGITYWVFHVLERIKIL